MTDVKALRDKLAEVDRQRRIADEAESARGKIRLGQRPVQRFGLLAFLSRTDPWPDQHFSQEETNAIYDALAVVRENARKRAAEIEKQIEDGVA
ncbi:MAG TPA: hypothetical protein VGL05_19350 [Kribbella sp.]